MAKLVRRARDHVRVLAVLVAVVASALAPLAAPSASAQILPPPPPPPPFDPTPGFGPPILPFPGFTPPLGLGAPWAPPGPMMPGLPPARPASDSQRSSAVTIQDNFFLPAEITIPVGTTVTWTNRGRVAHTSTDAGVWDSGRIPPGGSFSAVFAVAGTFDYVCTIHPEMKGRINVQVMAESTAPPPATTAPAGASTGVAPTTAAGTVAPGAPPAPASAQAAAGAATTGPAAAVAPAAPAAGQAGAMAMADLTPAGNSGVTGRAMLTQTGSTTSVTVTLSGLAPGSAHAGHIHSGACSGPIIFPLGTITADSAGQGSATATVNAPVDLNVWWVQYHASDNPPGPPIACGQPRAGGM